jgi:ABC-type siderophore export system fused ATPase/permease subunit
MPMKGFIISGIALFLLYIIYYVISVWIPFVETRRYLKMEIARSTTTKRKNHYKKLLRKNNLR